MPDVTLHFHYADVMGSKAEKILQSIHYAGKKQDGRDTWKADLSVHKHSGKYVLEACFSYILLMQRQHSSQSCAANLLSVLCSTILLLCRALSTDTRGRLCPLSCSIVLTASELHLGCALAHQSPGRNRKQYSKAENARVHA